MIEFHMQSRHYASL